MTNGTTFIPTSGNRLIDRLGEEPFALSFSGQGFAWLPTLRTALAAGARTTVAAHLAEAEELLRPLSDELAPLCPQGFDPLAWADADDDDSASPVAAPSAPAVSTPGIVTAQIAVLESLTAQGLDPAAAVTVLGHSQGVLATFAVTGRATAGQAIALGQLIGAAIGWQARMSGLIRTAQGAPMAAVTGIDGERLKLALDQAGADSGAASGGSRECVIGLRNARDAHVIVGPPSGIARVRDVLEREAAADRNEVESRQRGGTPLDLRVSDLDVDAGFHHPEMAAAVRQVEQWAKVIGLDAELAADGARGVLTDFIDWPKRVAEAADAGARWILECGPEAGVEPLTRKNVAGRGIGTLAVATAAGQEQLFDAGHAPALPRAWDEFAPQLNCEGRVETAFTRATGYPPVLLAGMTPTTVDPGIVAAAANAGFWAELAGGGQTTEEILRDNLARLGDLLNPGINAQFNAMYLSPKQWRTQIEGKRLVPRARLNGAPINGVVCSAGIPPLEEAVALVEQLKADTIPWVAFKPGSRQQISQVLAIADALKGRGSIIVQIEGGIAGGHHSWEDLDELLQATYGDIRSRDNVLLAVGGGIGTPARAADYLTGRWSTELGLPAMPVDAVLVGTAAMATKESTASESVKQALVATPGLSGERGQGWVGSGTARAGMASGRSQLGADIHEIDNSFARAGRLLDEVAGDAEAVAARRDEIIAAIARTAKPYFGDVADMTYAEWLERYLELSHLGRWRDASWARRFDQMLARTEARLAAADRGEIPLKITADFDAPDSAVAELVAAYPLAASERVCAADAAWFIDLLRGAGKPASFVPVIDADVRRWWRSDSLWQAHDDYYDADQVGIIPGTVAVAGIERANEPVAELLARFEAETARLLAAAEDAVEDGATTEHARNSVSPFWRVLSAPTVEWAGRQQRNPVRLLNTSWQFLGESGNSPETGATLERVDDAHVELRVPLDEAEELEPLRIRFTVPAGAPRSATPLVTAEDAEAAMAALTEVAAGGTLAPVIDGVARWQARLDERRLAAYESVLDAEPPAGRREPDTASTPDVLVGLAWPAIFSAVRHAEVRSAAGDEAGVVEGMLNLVHLEHRLELACGIVTPCDVDIIARCGEVLDTPVGRVVEVTAQLATDAGELATLTERFAIRGRAGDEMLPAGTAREHEVDTPVSFRHARTVVAPASMRPFAIATGDRNPIHVSDNAARLAGLEHGVIVHGMWTSAQAQLAAAFDGAHIVNWQAQMLAPVLPGASVEISVERSGIDTRPGLGEVRTVTAAVDGEVVLQARATVTAPVTFYGFPGQGIQAQGMGMEAFAASPAARAVWERADRHTRSALGFSILEIVRNNPGEVAVDGERFAHPDGTLFLTQFTQVAMATLACAQVAEMKEAGVLEQRACFAGHSVGEYNALAAYAEVLSLEAVVEIVYRRGLTMHRLVERDASGNSNYGLAALRPNKVGLRADEVFDYVAGVAERTGDFLEIVNYNIAGVQYAVAGTRAGLAALRDDAVSRAPGQRAFIMIPGIDVPFHSSRLLGGVADFREHLDSLIPEEIELDVLVGRYVPNLVARPFALTREFVEAIAEVVDSAYIAEILSDFEAAAARPMRLGRTLLIELLAWQFASPVRWIETQELLLTELGVQRFTEVGVGSSPTLANMLGQTLRLAQYSGAADAIEVLNAERDRPRVFATDAQPRPASEPDAAAPATADVTEEAPAAPEGSVPEGLAAGEAASPSPASSSAAEPSSGGPRPADLAFGTADATEMLVALWTKVRPDQMGAADTIEALVEGVSSRRNQLLLDLGVELGLGAIEGAADAEIDALKATVTAQAKGYRAFGPVLEQQVAEALRRLTGPAGKKPGYVAERVADVWQLGPGWADRATAELVLGTREGASLRGGELAVLTPAAPANAGELDELIDAAVVAAGTKAGVDISRPASAGAGGGAVVDSAALDAFAETVTGADGVLAATARDLLIRLGLAQGGTDFADEAAGGASGGPGSGADDAAVAQLVATELGSDWPRLVAPAFDAAKAVLLDDRWASAREDLARVASGELPASDVDVTGAGEEAAVMAEYLGLDKHAAQARVPASDLEFSEDLAVVTGGSPHSIAAAIIAKLLSGGATVIATTSRLDHERLEFYKELYRTNARGTGALWVVPANLNSFADVDALAAWIGQTQTATVGGSSQVVKPAMVPTLLFPFAAPRVAGTLADAGSQTESQMRLLLWSVERLIAGLSRLGADTHVAHRLHVVLPGSPNRGRFGGDGAYGEAKAALDALVTRWHAEPTWAARTSLVHAHIGWVRGTGLMSGNDPLVDAVEATGVRTFSTEAMAAELVERGASVGVREAAAIAPVTLDLTGGLASADIDFAELTRAANQAPAQDSQGPSAAEASVPRTVRALPAIRRPIEWTSPDFSEVTQGLDDMVVIVGAGELGPLGSARTRYEVELSGDLSAAGVLELAWSTGLISWDSAAGAWFDREDNEVAEEDIADRFHDEVLAGIGVRRYRDDFGPKMAMVDNLAPELTTIYLEKDLTFTVADEAAARSFVADVPGATAAFDGQEWQVTRPAGSPVRVPRRVTMSRFVGGQIPDGFDPAVYGIPADMVDNLDRLALWNLVCTVDAFLSAGFSPAELLAEVHPARVSSTQGTGMGGVASLRSLYVDKLLAEPRPNDILQEALPNVVAAHVMQSYVGGYGQMVHPVAACATAAVSVEEAMDKLRLRKADFVVAGGIDDLSIEGITGFGDMAATADSAEMAAKGIEERFFSRANDRRRGGFIESAGGGTLLLARGSLAADLGLPVLGVVAFAESFADGAHTSIPAPGLGALSAARGGADSRLAASLAQLGVTADDIAVISKHDTSTNANDPNESDLHERIAASLGRADGNPLYVVSQKALTGHAKGGAAAFQLVGLTQLLREGVLPPNRSLDCVDPVLRRHPHLTWLRRSLDLRQRPPKAGLVTSLGFGHVSALVAVVHPGAFLAALERERGDAAAAVWRTSAHQREAAGLRALSQAMHGGRALYQRPADRNLGATGERAKEREAAVLLDGAARLVDGVLSPRPTAPAAADAESAGRRE